MSAKRTRVKVVRPRSAASTFGTLVRSIQGVHEELAGRASHAVNLSLTARNWLIGWHVAEYELHGADRAMYGEKLLATLSVKLEAIGVSSCGTRQLYQYLRFYQAYPRIVRSVTAQFPALIPVGQRVREKVRSATAQSGVEPENILRRLSYTHIEQLVALDDSAARVFYERECIQATWSVRELKRQIASLYFERSRLSRDRKKLAALARRGAEKAPSRLAIRDPYVFEFLGLKSREVMGESHLGAPKSSVPPRSRASNATAGSRSRPSPRPSTG